MNARIKNMNASKSSRNPIALTASEKIGYEEKKTEAIKAKSLFLSNRKVKIKTRILLIA